MADKQSQPVIVMSAVIAGANVFVAGSAFIDTVPKWVSGLLALFVAALTVGWGTYVHSIVTPFPQVAARVMPDGSLRAGPAAPGLTKENDPVDVIWADPPPVAPPVV